MTVHTKTTFAWFVGSRKFRWPADQFSDATKFVRLAPGSSLDRLTVGSVIQRASLEREWDGPPADTGSLNANRERGTGTEDLGDVEITSISKGERWTRIDLKPVAPA